MKIALGLDPAASQHHLRRRTSANRAGKLLLFTRLWIRHKNGLSRD